MYAWTRSTRARTRVANKQPVIDTQDEDVQFENSANGQQRPSQFEKSAISESAQQTEQNSTSIRQDMEPVEVDEVANDTKSTQRKRKRGPTKMEIFRNCPNQKMEIDFNLTGQPLGANSVKFVSFLGVIARQNIPIVIEWKQLEEEKWKPLKDEVWSLVEQSFIVNDSHKGVIFKMMGKYWRQYKSKITREIIKANDELPNTPKKRRAFQLIKPPSVKSKTDWDAFVKARLATSFQARSQRFSALRKNQKYTHTMSRKGYARLEIELKANYPNPDEITRVELWTIGHQKKNGVPVNEAAAEIMEKIKKCNESTENPPSKDCVRDDALARVLGPESRGRVRGLGFGATHSKVDVIVKGNARVKELEAYVKTQDERIGTIEAQLQALLEINQKNPNNNVEALSVHVESPQFQSEQESYHARDQSTELQHAKCRLLNWYNFDGEEVVAEGHVASFDPRSLVNHVPVGRDCWKVWVGKVIDRNLAMYRPTDEFRKLGDALGSTVAWPKSSIKML